MTEVEVPEILEKFSKELKARQRQVISVSATPLNCARNADPLDLKESKFLGHPFLPEGSTYPMGKDDNPLVLIVQLNFAEIPNLPGFPDEGILQLFSGTEEWWDSSDAQKAALLHGSDRDTWSRKGDSALILDSCEEPPIWKFLYHTGTDLLKPPRTDLPFISPSSYEELPMWKVHSLKFSESIDTGGALEDCQFSFNFGEKDWWGFWKKLSETDKIIFDEYFSSPLDKIGGYADFIHDDLRRHKESRKNDIQILQIYSGEQINFGDAGIGHIFISPENLANGKLEKAYFYWD